MEDVRWFGKILSDIDDEIWRMGQISRELKEYRKDIQGHWNDAASREIGARYLNPHEEDDKEMLKELGEQKDKLEELNQRLARVYELGVQANMCRWRSNRLWRKHSKKWPGPIRIRLDKPVKCNN